MVQAAHGVVGVGALLCARGKCGLGLFVGRVGMADGDCDVVLGRVGD